MHRMLRVRTPHICRTYAAHTHACGVSRTYAARVLHVCCTKAVLVLFDRHKRTYASYAASTPHVRCTHATVIQLNCIFQGSGAYIWRTPHVRCMSAISLFEYVFLLVEMAIMIEGCKIIVFAVRGVTKTAYAIRTLRVRQTYAAIHQ